MYNSLRHGDNRKYFSGLSLTRNRRKPRMFYLTREVGGMWRCFGWEKGSSIMINEFKYGKLEKFDYLHLLYHFTVPLSVIVLWRKFAGIFFFFINNLINETFSKTKKRKIDYGLMFNPTCLIKSLGLMSSITLSLKNNNLWRTNTSCHCSLFFQLWFSLF